MADDDAASLATASTYWRDAAVLAETFSRRRAPPPKPPAPDLSTMPPMRDHVDAWLARLKALESRWTCPPDAQFRLEVLGAKTRAEEKKWRAKEILRRTPAQEKVVHVEEVERDYAVPQYGPYDVLAYHSGSKGRREFFRIQQAAHARPSLAEETALKMADDADQYEGACFRNFVHYANAKGLLPSPFLSRVDAEERSLDLNGMALGDALGGAVASSLPRLPGLESLSLAGNRLTDITLAPLLDGLLTLKDLRSVDLSGNKMDAKGALALQNLLKTKTCRLTKVMLRSSDVDDDECRALCEALEHNSSSRLEHLDLSRNLIGFSEERNVTKPDYITGGEALASVITATPSLTVLDLSWNSVRGASSEALASALRTNKTLILIDLSHNRLDELGGVAVAAALEANTSLEEVKLAHCAIGAKGAIVLGQALTERAKPLPVVDFSGNVPGKVGAAALLRAVRALRGATAISLIGCDCGRLYDVFDEGDPEGEWDLELDDSCEFCVARALLKLATASDDCRLAAVKVNGSVVKLVRDESEPTASQLWKPVLSSIDQGQVPDLVEVLVAYGLDPPYKTTVALAEGTLEFIKALPCITLKSGKEKPQPATEALVFDGVFRTACILADADGSGDTDAEEATIMCRDLLGVELSDADRLIAEASNGLDSCTFAEFSAYAAQTYAQQTPCLRPAPLLDGAEVWNVPREGILYVDVELELGFGPVADRGVRGLAAVVKCCLTDDERLQLITTAGGGFSKREAQEILNACAPPVGLDAPTIYALCKALAPAITSGCAAFLEANLTERQHLALRCECGPLWNVYVGLLDGHYAFDTGCSTATTVGVLETLTLLASKCQVMEPDTSQDQTRNPWRNGTINGIPSAVDPLDLGAALPPPPSAEEAPEADEDAGPPSTGRVVAFDVSVASPVPADATPLADDAFEALKARVRCDEWCRGASSKKEPDADARRLVASENRKRAALAYAAAVARGEPTQSAPSDGAPSFLLDWPTSGGRNLLDAHHCRAQASQLEASSARGLDTSRLDACGGAVDEEEEEFDGATVSLCEGEERRALVNPTSVKHAVRLSVGRCGVGCVLEGVEVLPGVHGLSWLAIRLAHLDVVASTTYFSAAQVFELYAAMPLGHAWAELRIRLLVTLFSRTMDSDAYCARANDLPGPDSLRLRHRLGILNVWDPRIPLKNGVLRLSKPDDRLVAKTILALAGGGSSPAFNGAQFRESEDVLVLGGWRAPSEETWSEMDPSDMDETRLPRHGTLTFTSTADPGPSGESFLDVVACGREKRAGAVFVV